jgi:hypothetical protein
MSLLVRLLVLVALMAIAVQAQNFAFPEHEPLAAAAASQEIALAQVASTVSGQSQWEQWAAPAAGEREMVFKRAICSSTSLPLCACAIIVAAAVHHHLLLPPPLLVTAAAATVDRHRIAAPLHPIRWLLLLSAGLL